MAKNINDGLVLDLQMDSLEDFGSGRTNGTATGTTLTNDHLNRLNKARSFNGSSDYISTDNTFDLAANSYTFEGWIKYDDSTPSIPQCPFAYDTSGGRRNVLTNYLTTAGYMFVQWNTATHYHWFGASGVDITSLISSGTWHHYFYVWTANTGLSLYIDNKFVATTTSGAYAYIVTANEFALGRRGGYSELYLEGDISNFKIWNRALDANERTQIYNDTKPAYQGLFEDCVGYWDFNKDAKDIINQNDGTVTGATLTTDKFGIANNAYSFVRASSQYITIPNTALGTDNFTWSFWFSANENTLRYELMGNWLVSNKSELYYGGNNTNELALLLYVGTTQKLFVISNSNVITDTNPHLITIVRDSTTSGKIYVDGIDVTSSSTQTGAAVSLNNTTTYIGQVGDGTNYVNGKFENLIIHNRAFSADEAKTLYDLTSKKYIYPYMKKTLE